MNAKVALWTLAITFALYLGGFCYIEPWRRPVESIAPATAVQQNHDRADGNAESHRTDSRRRAMPLRHAGTLPDAAGDQ